jgi:ubiquinone biosynthesis protein
MSSRHNTVSRGRRWARYREIATVLYEEHVFHILRASGLDEDAPCELTDEKIEELEAAHSGKKLPQEVRVRRALERLGPAFVKVGQLLSTRRDLISPALAEELAKLQDNVPTLPFPKIRKRIEEELGGKLEDLFTSFDPEPLASASIGQVYRATLKDGSEVVVKVQRPGITETMEVDLDIILSQAHSAAQHTRFGRDLNVVEIAQQMVDALRSELDYLHEAADLDFFHTAFGDSDEVYFPRVYWDLTTSRVLTMEMMKGIPGTRLGELDTAGIDRQQVAMNGTSCYFKQIFEMGRYHADPHLGNLFIMPDGRIGFVDFGRVGLISERNRNLTFHLIMALMEGDEVEVTETVLDMTGAGTTVDVTALQHDMGRVCTAYASAQAGSGTLDPAVEGLFDAVRKYRLCVPGQIVMLLTVVGVLDGVATLLSGGTFRIAEVAQPFAQKLLPQEFGPDHMKTYLMRYTRRYGKFLEDLPVSLGRVLRRAGEGEMRIAVRPEKYDRMVDRLEAIANRVCVALLLAALIVGMSFLSGVDHLNDTVTSGSQIVLLMCILFGIWWLSAPLRAKWRRRKD